MELGLRGRGGVDYQGRITCPLGGVIGSRWCCIEV
jgi:hypothetical protein